jgi:hypothetical protein
MSTDEVAELRASLEVFLARIYEDLGQDVGLTDVESEALIRLIVEQRMRDMNLDHSPAALEKYSEWQTQFRREIEAQIGAARARDFDEYQHSINARYEVEELRREFEATSVPISEAQRKALIRGAIDAQAYVQERPFTSAEAPLAVFQEMLVRIEQRDQRFDPVARRVLDVNQYAHYQAYAAQRRVNADATLRGLELEQASGR